MIGNVHHWYPRTMRFHIKTMLRQTPIRLGLCTLLVPALAGCHSHYIEATIQNDSGATVSLVELDYPSASFGKESLLGGTAYHYRFKILGDGPTKILWTDAQHHDHTVPGPSLREGEEGKLTVIINGVVATWHTELR
jgi:hypothetical protein